MLAGLITIQTIVYDAWKLLTPEAIMDRWFSAAILLLITGFIWYFVKTKSNSVISYKSLLLALIMTDLALASFYAYNTRGMASRAVILFVLPILISALSRSKRAVITTALLATIIYAVTSFAYFTLNFNEGYKVELYGEVGFYSAILMIIAWLTAAVLNIKK